MALHDLTIPMTNAELEERDLFNQRKGEMKNNISIIEKDLLIFTKKLIMVSNYIRNLDFFNIGISSFVVLSILILGFLNIFNIVQNDVLGLLISSLSGFEFIRNISILIAIKRYFSKQKNKYILLRNNAQEHRDKLFLYTQKCLEDGLISFNEIEMSLKIFSDYTNEKNKILEIQNF